MDDESRATLSSALGWLSVVFWMFNNLPQLYETFLVQSGRGVSRFHIRLFALGDLLNLVGCIFADQLHTQIYLAAWFLFFDLVLMVQLSYYDHGKGIQYHPIDSLNSETLITTSFSSVPNQDYGGSGQTTSAGLQTQARTHVRFSGHASDGTLSDQSQSSIPQQHPFDSPGDDSSLLSYGSSFGGTPYGYCSPSSSQIFHDSMNESVRPDSISSRAGPDSISSRTGPGQSLFSFYNERTNEYEFDPQRRGTMSSRSRSGSYVPRDSRLANSAESDPVDGKSRRTHRLTVDVVGPHELRTCANTNTNTSTSTRGGISIESLSTTRNHGKGSVRMTCTFVLALLFLPIGAYIFGYSNREQESPTFVSRTLVSVAEISRQSTVLSEENLDASSLFGVVIGALSAGVYVFARIPQLYRICRHGASPIAGVGVFVLWCGVFGNLCYGASVGVYCLNWTEFAISIPWLLGSLGCVPLDVALFLLPMCYQAAYIQNQSTARSYRIPRNVDHEAVREYRRKIREEQ